jgi:hypothetical protein
MILLRYLKLFSIYFFLHVSKTRPFFGFLGDNYFFFLPCFHLEPYLRGLKIPLGMVQEIIFFHRKIKSTNGLIFLLTCFL